MHTFVAGVMNSRGPTPMSSRPCSAGCSRRSLAAVDANAPVVGRHRDKDAAAGAPARARSAQSRQASARPSRSIDPERVIQALQAQCLELKCAANTANEENMKMRTRMKAVERELQKRDRVLRQLAQLNKAGQGVGMDLIEKLREERNMLPVYRKKAQDVQALIDDKETKIKELKRNPQFTKIIELQVEFASWQHEVMRLDNLLREPSSDVNDAAKREIEIHEQRANKLENNLAAAEAARANVLDELSRTEADHKKWTQEYNECETRLAEQQDITRKSAMDLKELLQQRKEKEQLQDELEALELDKQRYEEELSQLDPGMLEEEQTECSPRCSVSWAALHGPLRQPSSDSLTRLRAFHRAAEQRSGQDALFWHLLAQDQDSDGLVSKAELSQGLCAAGCPFPPDEVVALLLDHLPQHDSDNGPRVHWLDVVIILERLWKLLKPPLSHAILPDLRPLRSACFQKSVSSESLHQQISNICTPAQAEKVFHEIGLNDEQVERWVHMWQVHGSLGLLLRLPMSEAAQSESARQAWLCRCSDAIRIHKNEIMEAFTVWRPDMQLTEKQCVLVCNDLLGVELSEEDVDDLVLFAGGGSGGEGEVDGAMILRLAER